MRKIFILLALTLLTQLIFGSELVLRIGDDVLSNVSGDLNTYYNRTSYTNIQDVQNNFIFGGELIYPINEKIDAGFGITYETMLADNKGNGCFANMPFYLSLRYNFIKSNNFKFFILAQGGYSIIVPGSYIDGDGTGDIYYAGGAGAEINRIEVLTYYSVYDFNYVYVNKNTNFKYSKFNITVGISL